MSASISAKVQLEKLEQGAVSLFSREELLKRLEAGKPLRVKAGFDPTRPDLHLGHTVLINKMRQFQDLGHQVIFVVGDFTAQIGDPSGRNATRPTPTREEIESGARTYAEQAFRILDRSRTEIVYNSEWLGKMCFDDVIRLAAKYPLARMMERDDFKKRWHEHISISLHELLYPLAQAYDSVVLKADVELGGTDQLFNLMVGRDLMREYGLRPQIVMTTPILEGLTARFEDGHIVGDKMSKSLDNYVGVIESADSQFGKLMSISDELMWRYYSLLSSLGAEEIKAKQNACASGQMNPKQAKVDLAQEIIARYHSSETAKEAHQRWESQFSKREVPEQMPEYYLSVNEDGVWLPKALVEAKLCASTTVARRLVEQNAVEIDGTKVTDVQMKLAAGGRYVIRSGKRQWALIIT